MILLAIAVIALSIVSAVQGAVILRQGRRIDNLTREAEALNRSVIAVDTLLHKAIVVDEEQ